MWCWPAKFAVQCCRGCFSLGDRCWLPKTSSWVWGLRISNGPKISVYYPIFCQSSPISQVRLKSILSDFSSRPWRNLPPTWVIHMPPSELFPPGLRAWRACEVEVRYPPLKKGYLSDTCAIPCENKAHGCDTPLCDTISKGYCAIWGGFSHWAASPQHATPIHMDILTEPNSQFFQILLNFADFCFRVTAFRRRRFSQRTAGNRRFSQRTAGNRRFSQKTAEFCRSTFQWFSLSPLIPPYVDSGLQQKGQSAELCATWLSSRKRRRGSLWFFSGYPGVQLHDTHFE